MNSPYIPARVAAVIGGAALVTMASFVASCSKTENQAPSTSTVAPTTTSSPSATPTEKVLSPTDGNKFSPTVMAPPAPTESGGNHHHGLNGTS
ncbi:hypothetical protein [Mycolicibacterium sphagni]|uniref:Secreted protein n=1 Tax=Mycolicibacterium sphagni TaxID=1786 RepID=A0ABX2K2J3_9MYCO|nr:hypothetical protein [Mycolicibacterium sphagni]NTY63417.1 hypothetical protein [Mycolicibacterium sphagni]